MKINIVKKYNSVPIQIRASIWFLFCLVLQKGINIITMPIFTRLMTSSEFGNYNVFNTWVDILSVFISLKLYYGVYTQGLIKFEEFRDKYTSSIIGISFFMAMLWFIILILFSHKIANLMNINVKYIYFIVPLVWTQGIFLFWSAEKRVDLDYKNLVIFTIISTIFRTIFSVILTANLNDKVMGRILGLLIVDTLLYSYLLFGQVRRSFKLFDKKIWKYALGFSIPLVPHYLSQSILNGSDRIMISQIIGDSESGIYSLAYSLSFAMMIINNALTQTINPWYFRKLKQKRYSEIKRVVYPAVVLVLFANLFFILVAPEIIKLFATPEYYEAIYIIPPLAISGFFIFLYNMFANLEMYYEKKYFIMISTVTSAIVNIVLNYFLIKKFGYLAAGYTTLFSYVIYALLHYLFMRRICRVDLKTSDLFDIKVILGVSLIILIIGNLMIFLYNFILIRYIVAVFIIIGTILSRKKIISIINNVLRKE